MNNMIRYVWKINILIVDMVKIDILIWKFPSNSNPHLSLWCQINFHKKSMVSYCRGSDKKKTDHFKLYSWLLSDEVFNLIRRIHSESKPRSACTIAKLYLELREAAKYVIGLCSFVIVLVWNFQSFCTVHAGYNILNAINTPFVV